MCLEFLSINILWGIFSGYIHARESSITILADNKKHKYIYIEIEIN